MAADEHEVVIAGGGSTGLMLAAELRLAGSDVVLVERRENQQLAEPRARGLHARTLEVLDQRGVVDRFLAEGQTHPALGFGQIQLDLSDAPSRHNYLLALLQRDIERILADWVLGDLAVPILRGREVVGLSPDGDGVDVAVSDGSSLRAGYLVGCDGGRSTVRKAAGIDFPGLPASASWIMAEVDFTETPPLGLRPEGGGIGPATPGAPGGPYGVVLRERSADHDGEPTMAELRDALVAAFGTDLGVHSPAWISRFSDMSRQAATYRRGRVLVAGDAAHVHPPHGGQGLNVGVQDAVNLGWKLAQVVRGRSPDTLLDTYHAERHPVGARVLHNTQTQAAMAGTDERHQSLRETMAELLAMDEPRRHVAGMVSGLDVRYDLGGDHPLVGRRMPDLDLRSSGGHVRTYQLLHEARPLLLDLTGERAFDVRPWDRLRFTSARHDGDWVLPVIGPVRPTPAVLVRPDGYVAWTGELDDPELPEALARWLGPPVTATGDPGAVDAQR